MTSGWPPLRVPLFMMATRGPIACTSTVGVRVRLPVMGHHEKINRADRIVRAHQIEFLVARQVAQMQNAELAKRDEDPDRSSILRRCQRPGLEPRAIGVRLARSRQRSRDGFACGRHHAHIETGDRNLVTDFTTVVVAFGGTARDRSVAGRSSACTSGWTFMPWSMNSRIGMRAATRGHRAEVITVPVGGHQVIDV